MDYLLDQYFFKYVPFDVSDEWKKYITGKAVHLIRVRLGALGLIPLDSRLDL